MTKQNEEPQGDGPPVDHDMKRLASHCTVLMEHYDSVQIFVTRYAGAQTGTYRGVCGSGNYYARRGQIQEWIVKENTAARNEVGGGE